MSLLYGGFQVQIDAFVAACVAASVDCRAIDHFDRLDRFDVIHCWGFEPQAFGLTLRIARSAGVRTVVTALLPSAPEPPPLKLLFSLRQSLAALAPEKRAMRKNIDALVVLSEEQRSVAVGHFGFRDCDVHVIPNIIPEPFWKADWRPSRANPYVLCLGNICLRKNQLLLAQAAVSEQFRLVLAGGEVPGESRYYREVLELAAGSEHVDFRGNLETGSHELVELIRMASAVVLLSTQETQPLAILEAAAIGVPIILLESPYVRQSYLRGALIVSHTNPKTIADAVREVKDRPMSYLLDRDDLMAFTSEHVGSVARELYESLLR